MFCDPGHVATRTLSPYMIVNQFLVWAKTAPTAGRADGASALARAYLYSDLSDLQRTEAARALTSLLDDPSPLVRRAIAEAFASAVDAPHHIVLALAEDQASIASLVLARSPVLTEAELIDCAATASPQAQAAIAGRADLSSAVAAALAEIAAPEALIELAANSTIQLPAFSIRRMIERHGAMAELREALLARSDLPSSVRVDLVAATAKALSEFVVGCNWMSGERVARVTREAKDRAAIIICDDHPDRAGAVELIAHLRQAGQLTVGFVFRALLSGKVELFKAALADLSGLPLTRVDGLTAQSESTGFAALYRKADLPIDLLPAFRIALRAGREIGWRGVRGPSLSLAIIERVLTGCEAINSGELDKLIVLLRRFESEAARDAARAPAALQPLILREPAVPLLLRDFEADDAGRRPRNASSLPVFDRSAIDLDAIAAELQAA